MDPVPTDNLPDASSTDLVLCQPTPAECLEIWTRVSASWKNALTVPAFMEESNFLTTVPLARDGGLTMWALVDKNKSADGRTLLSSCETFRKRGLTSDADGNVDEVIVHAIASVFCAPAYRRRGYAARLMKELADKLRHWQSEYGTSIGSVLYSDVGKFYTKFGWATNATNFHLDFSPIVDGIWPDAAQLVTEDDIEALCKRDEAIVRSAMAEPSSIAARRMTIPPTLDHMLWHIRKTEFSTSFIFGEIPWTKGAISGSPGNQTWAIWAHRYYDHALEHDDPDNVLYILRFVVEGDKTANRAQMLDAASNEGDAAANEGQIAAITAILHAALAEASKWRLNRVQLWEPSRLVQRVIKQVGLEHVRVEREEESVASGMWYGEDGRFADAPLWINNERYAWC